MEPSAAGFGFKLDEITKSLGENSEFWNQFAGSGIANVFMTVTRNVNVVANNANEIAPRSLQIMIFSHSRAQ